MVAECLPVPADQRVLSYDGQTLVPVCEDLLVDPTTTDAERAHVVRNYVAAVRRNQRFYGRLLALRPLTVLCKTEACRHYFVGDMEASITLLENSRAEGAGYTGDERRTIVLTHRGYWGHVLAHELSHAELAYRVGDSHVPAWFNEGLATIVGDDPSCEFSVLRDSVHLDDVEHQDQWNAYTQQHGHGDTTYCKARDEVLAWFTRHAQTGLVDLLHRVRGGEGFTQVYGPRLTPP
jgi:hypothetical protein